jgi:hypothetical protein
MTSNIISRAACLAELTSNPKSFFNCPDMHGGLGLPEGARNEERGSQGATFTAGVREREDASEARESRRSANR